MGSTRKGLDGFVVTMMTFLCAIWGAQQVAIKLAAHDVVPLMQVGLRSGLSAALVLLLVAIRRERLSLRDGTLRPGLLAGALFATEFLFVAEGLRRTSASHMAVLLYTSPIFTAVGLHWTVPGERLRRRQWLGILLAFAGIAVAFAGGWMHGGITAQMLLGDAFGVLAGVAWGATTVVIRASALSDAAPAKTLLYQLVVAAVLLVVAAAVSGQATQVSLTRVAWASLLFQGVVVSFASYLAWLWLLRHYAAAQVSVFSFLTPLFGVTFGVLVLGERVGLAFGVGAALVLAGITVVSTPGLRRRATPAAPSVGPELDA
ncbi:DMT family transporter [Anaeromyxobacter oryzisoli]|uniref:DMT family transporter n=1 Tax=Anaeromyxobacter oryzisoli TaxID=2925408 RepID=UPI001F56CBCA|nr:DMT family transporter [Anaeromyxobacter sp. SG63]